MLKNSYNLIILIAFIIKNLKNDEFLEYPIVNWFNKYLN